MALTSLITSLRISTFLTSGQSQVTKLDLSVHGSPETQARLSVAQINVQAQPPTLSRLSDVKINAHVAPPTAERLTRIEVDAWVSLDQAFYALGVFGSNEVMMPDFLVEPIFDTPAAPEVEVNPYRAAEANTDLQQILREQHMTTQAGDSTFHWGVLTEIYNEPLYNLGSLGKFYHDTLGIIHARYCRFVDFNHTDAKAVPVGMRKPLNLPWTVTNQIDLSSADAVIGMAIPYDEKVNIGTWYGWVITEGFVPAEPAIATSNLAFGFGTEYGWNASGELKQELDVVSVGYRTAIGGTPRLVPGAFYVNTDRSSLGKANGLITARITPLVDDINGIKVRLTTLEAGHAAQELALTAINKKHDDFATFMSKEVQNLANAMNAIRALMPDGNFKEYVDTSINNLKGYVDTQLTITNQVANSALAKANQALSAIDSMSYDSIQVQINALNNAMGGITDRIIGFKTTIDTNTLVAGQTLVSYLYDTDVDGVNYYDFRPVDFALQNLVDVDLVTAPPADGDSLVWDSTTQKWIPFAVSGGGGGGGGTPDTYICAPAIAFNLGSTGVTAGFFISRPVIIPRDCTITHVVISMAVARVDGTISPAVYAAGSVIGARLGFGAPVTGLVFGLNELPLNAPLAVNKGQTLWIGGLCTGATITPSLVNGESACYFTTGGTTPPDPAPASTYNSQNWPAFLLKVA